MLKENPVLRDIKALMVLTEKREHRERLHLMERKDQPAKMEWSLNPTLLQGVEVLARKEKEVVLETLVLPDHRVRVAIRARMLKTAKKVIVVTLDSKERTDQRELKDSLVPLVLTVMLKELMVLRVPKEMVVIKVIAD